MRTFVFTIIVILVAITSEPYYDSYEESYANYIYTPTPAKKAKEGEEVEIPTSRLDSLSIGKFFKKNFL